MAPPTEPAPGSGRAPQRRLCAVYRSSRVAEMYLYVDLQEGLQRVPEALLERFGIPQLVFKIPLHPARALARVDVVRVLQALDEPGYFLQMPPPDLDPMDSSRGPAAP